MAISQATVGTSATTILGPVPASTAWATTCVFLMNNNAAARTVQIYVIPSGGSASVTTQIIKDLAIDGADTYVLNTEKLFLATGDFIQVTASAATSIYATVSYMTI